MSRARGYGAPEILDGRVKAANPKIHCGTLPTGASFHVQMADQGIEPIDCRLQPLSVQRTSRTRGPRRDAIEQIDVGGPAMLGPAANFHSSRAS